MAEDKSEKLEQISLFQAVLGPVDAILEAQLQAARSFLSVLLQFGYPHQPVDDDGKPIPPDRPDKGQPFMQEFFHEVVVGDRVVRQKITVPTLALVPIAPLAMDEAHVRLKFSVTESTSKSQLNQANAEKVDKNRKYNAEKRPWMFEPPKQFIGHLAPTDTSDSSQTSSSIDVQLKLSRVPMPSGLDRLLTALTQTGGLQDVPNNSGEGDNNAG